jgi:hypothetical protein
MRAMSKRTLAALVMVWLLGIVTALVTPSLVYQRQSIAAWDKDGDAAVRRGTTEEWVIVREDRNTFTLERPRFRIP